MCSAHANIRTAGDAGARVVIADNGPGISLQNREKIFEPFFTTKGEAWHWTRPVGQQRNHREAWRLDCVPQLRQGRNGTVFNVFLPYEATEPQDEPSLSVEGFA
jgi:nitrogen-specific signal transduction histidine kinase